MFEQTRFSLVYILVLTSPSICHMLINLQEFLQMPSTTLINSDIMFFLHHYKMLLLIKVYVCTYIYIYIFRMYISHVYIYIYIYIYICMYIPLYNYIYIYTHPYYIPTISATQPSIPALPPAGASFEGLVDQRGQPRWEQLGGIRHHPIAHVSGQKRWGKVRPVTPKSVVLWWFIGYGILMDIIV